MAIRIVLILTMKKLLYLINKFLKHPLWLLMVCVFVVCAHLILGGTLLQMWQLYNSRKVLENRIASIQAQNILVEERLKKMSDSHFLEREVRDRFNLVGEEDIIFIFSKEAKDKAMKENGEENLNQQGSVK